MNAIVVAIFAKPSLGFSVGHEVAVFLRNYFSRHDGTITSFIRALKVRLIVIIFIRASPSACVSRSSQSYMYLFLADCLY